LVWAFFITWASSRNRKSKFKKELKQHFEELTFEKVKKSGKVTNLIIYFKFKEEDNFEIELLPNYNISKIEEYFSTTFWTRSSCH